MRRFLSTLLLTAIVALPVAAQTPPAPKPTREAILAPRHGITDDPVTWAATAVDLKR